MVCLIVDIGLLHIVYTGICLCKINRCFKKLRAPSTIDICSISSLSFTVYYNAYWLFHIWLFIPKQKMQAYQLMFGRVATIYCIAFLFHVNHIGIQINYLKIQFIKLFSLVIQLNKIEIQTHFQNILLKCAFTLINCVV